MSYEIIYNKQFIKVGENAFIPMLYWGSNNCYTNEMDRRGRSYQKRERNWSRMQWITGDRITASYEDMLKAVEKEIAKGISDCLTIGGRAITEAQYRNLIVYGVKY
jgi:hypothetical protein